MFAKNEETYHYFDECEGGLKLVFSVGKRKLCKKCESKQHKLSNIKIANSSPTVQTNSTTNDLVKHDLKRKNQDDERGDVAIKVNKVNQVLNNIIPLRGPTVEDSELFYLIANNYMYNQPFKKEEIIKIGSIKFESKNNELLIKISLEKLKEYLKTSNAIKIDKEEKQWLINNVTSIEFIKTLNNFRENLGKKFKRLVEWWLMQA